MSVTQIDLDKIFQAVVAKYDEISPILVANNFGMDMVRARQKPADKKPLPNPDILESISLEELSHAEELCLKNSISELGNLSRTYNGIQINSLFSRKAEKLNNANQYTNVHADARDVGEYLTWHARLKFSEMIGIELNTKPDLKPLERHLGLAQ